MSINREKDELMWTLAEKMAKSGEHLGWKSIELELSELGYSRAQLLLDNEETRNRIDNMCAVARKYRTDA